MNHENIIIKKYAKIYADNLDLYASTNDLSHLARQLDQEPKKNDTLLSVKFAIAREIRERSSKTIDAIFFGLDKDMMAKIYKLGHSILYKRQSERALLAKLKRERLERKAQNLEAALMRSAQTA